VRAGRAVEMMLRKLPRDIESLISQSAKLRCLGKLLPTLGSLGHRTLIFSQGIKMMDLIEICILKKLGITYLRIDGSTDVQSRADRVQQFQTQPDKFQCMLLTTSVGGYGLNLTGADRVILVDPAWNPAVDAQAVDRVYRIGQKREVRVYRLVMSGLIEDKMFRLQVFKMGLTKTALEAKQQQRYFTSSEIRGLFEWTDPVQGETRNVLVEKHGEEQENVAMVNAQEDRAQESWYAAGPTLGFSNFSILYSSLADEDMEPEQECEAQVVEMKAKLGQVDENIQRTAEQRQAIEEELKVAQDGVQEAAKKIMQASASRSKAAELAKRRQSDVTRARRSEATAMQHLEKVMKRRVAAREAKVNADQALLQVEYDMTSSSRAAAEACTSWHGAMEAMELVFQNVQGTLAIAQPEGKVKTCQKCCERVTKTWEAVKASWTGFEATEDAFVRMLSAPDTREKDLLKAEGAREKAAQRAESNREAGAAAVAALVESGCAYAETLQGTEPEHLTAAALKVMQQTAKSKFRELSSAWIKVKQLQEAWLKASHLRHRIAKKVSAAASSRAEADAWLQTVESEHEDALVAEERERSARLLCEQALLEAEAQRNSAEVDHVGQKCRRSECMAAIGSARAQLRPARIAEKEASAGRLALLGHYSKADRGQLKAELHAAANSAKEAISAVRALKAEEYDANQVEDAYNQCQAKKKQRTDAAAETE